jgi:hypothetical protein
MPETIPNEELPVDEGVQPATRSAGAIATATLVGVLLGVGGGLPVYEQFDVELKPSDISVAEYVAANVDSVSIVRERLDEVRPAGDVVVYDTLSEPIDTVSVPEVIVRPKDYMTLDVTNIDTLRTVVYCGDRVLGVSQMPLITNPDNTKITRATIQITVDDVVR